MTHKNDFYVSLLSRSEYVLLVALFTCTGLVIRNDSMDVSGFSVVYLYPVSDSSLRHNLYTSPWLRQSTGSHSNERDIKVHTDLRYHGESFFQTLYRLPIKARQENKTNLQTS
jgi:hypothetical protein